MTDKYVDISATYNGDGTASNQATSDGGVGAWNDIISVLEGSPAYGSVEAGDIIHIRTYNGGDLNVVLSGNVTLTSVATQDNPIVFEFDNGDVWSQGGRLTFQQSSTYKWYWDDHIIFKASYSFDNTTDIYTSGCRFYVDSASQLIPWHYVSDNVFIGVEFDGKDHNQIQCVKMNGYKSAKFIGCYFNNSTNNAGINYSSFAESNSAKAQFYECYFDARNVVTGASGGILSAGAYNNRVEIIGGKAVNTGTDKNLISHLTPSNIRNSLTYGIFYIYGLDLNGLNLVGQGGRLAMNDYITAVLINEDSYYSDGCGEVDFFRGNGYPTLNATLSDGTPWSYRCLPSGTVNVGYPLHVPRMNKFYDSAAGVVTAKVELLIKDTSGSGGAYDNPTNQHFWAVLTYIDDTNNVSRSIRTLVDGAGLITSTAGWSTTTYNGDSYNKYKIELTTPTNVKQGTWVYVDVYCGVPSVNNNDYFFVEPEIILS